MSTAGKKHGGRYRLGENMYCLCRLRGKAGHLERSSRTQRMCCLLCFGDVESVPKGMLPVFDEKKE